MTRDYLTQLQQRAEALASDLRMTKCAAMEMGDEEAHDIIEGAEDKVDEARALIAKAIKHLGQA